MGELNQLIDRLAKKEDQIDQLLTNVEEAGSLISDMRGAIKELVAIIENHQKANRRAGRACDRDLYAGLDKLNLGCWEEEEPC